MVAIEMLCGGWGGVRALDVWSLWRCGLSKFVVGFGGVTAKELWCLRKCVDYQGVVVL
jgi:hypothetical protein